ncbi:hypothetical protein BpHYR1_006375 [Brachionus plicatilis]|uniref:Uncharacterized protein n=1 Tax=Brachionus plicatilis TaxID=10195 RepID=A0A3M7R6E2_BRAPC|nr:hypothetical protein BpHYR1_006375 [Brachionus plicatilis]
MPSNRLLDQVAHKILVFYLATASIEQRRPVNTTIKTFQNHFAHPHSTMLITSEQRCIANQLRINFEILFVNLKKMDLVRFN